MKRFLPVSGTHGFRGNPSGNWHQKGPFLSLMQNEGFIPYNINEPFEWTTSVAGHRVWRNWLGLGDPHIPWVAAGINLAHYLVPPMQSTGDCCCGTATGDHRSIVPKQVRIVCHSHGVWPVLEAAARGVKMHTVISLMSPFRHDKDELIMLALRNINRWTHVYSDNKDRMAIWGGIGDRKSNWKLNRRFPQAHENIFIPGGHSVCVRPETFFVWEKYGLLEILGR